MTLATLALVLASALVHATWNLWAKQLGPSARSGPLMWLLVVISAVAYAPPALLAVLHGGWRPDPAALALILGSGVIHVGYFVLLLRGYRAADFSLVYPVARGTGPLLAASAAIVVFAEKPTVFSVAGLLLIVTGIVVLTWHPDPGRQAKLAPGLRHGLSIGALIAVYTLWDGWAVKRAGVPPLLYYWAGEVVRVAIFTPVALADRAGVAALWREQRPRVLGIALLSPLSYILILLAMRTGAISHIAPAREIAILLGTYLGGRVLGEGDRHRRLAAAGAFAAGVIALALARG
ncbi:MAG: EamA family transporter [Candidatus Eisenbacteria bacterium]|nr:EamA family transporter [Candidatus Eisenbacteria bacterium]